jgi:2-isopropylmalate synthase
MFYDVTLRDGAQEAGVNFGVDEKLAAARLLDRFGVHYIEGGWPIYSPTSTKTKDTLFFERAKKELQLRNAKLVAFGSTRHAKNSVEDDPNLRGLLESGANVCTLVGKTSLFHVTNALQVSPDENLRMIYESIAYLKANGIQEVFFDCEHSFDGFKYDQEYMLSSLRAAVAGGADCIVLCDTNGGTTTEEMAAIISVIQQDPYLSGIPLGIHAHNDIELAVANTLMAIELGVQQIQGTVNGYGERLGNTNWLTVLGILASKQGYTGFTKKQLRQMTSLSRKFDQLCGYTTDGKRSFVGPKAATHKAGYHGSGLKKAGGTAYEHVDFSMFGNSRTIAISEMSGIANIQAKLEEIGVFPDADTTFIQLIITALKENDLKGYRYDTAEASFELLVRRLAPNYSAPFSLELFHADYSIEDAHDAFKALRKQFARRYLQLNELSIVSYTHQKGIGMERIFLTVAHGESQWTVMTADPSYLTAAKQAAVDAIEYMLLKM